MSLDSVRHQEQNFIFVLSASKYFSEKSDFSRITLTYPILKSKFLKSTKFATGRFLLAAAHIGKGSAKQVKHTSNKVGAGIIRMEGPLKGETVTHIKPHYTRTPILQLACACTVRSP